MENQNTKAFEAVAEQPTEEQSSLERAKALFEYEMTEVLLNFRQEAATMKGRDSSEYLSMEVPPAGVEYAAPAVALEGIGYEDKDTRVTLDAETLRAEAPSDVSVTAPAIPDVDLTAVSVGAPAFVSVPAPEIPAVELSTAFHAETEDLSVSVPVPEVRSVTFEKPPAPTLAGVDAVPEARLDAEVFLLSLESRLTFTAEIPTLEKQAVVFEPGGAELKSAPITVPDAPPAELQPIPSSPELRMAVTVEDADVPQIPEMNKAELVWQPVSVPDAVPVSFETMPAEAQIPGVCLPPIPEKPDFSAEYAEITELLRAEL